MSLHLLAFLLLLSSFLYRISLSLSLSLFLSLYVCMLFTMSIFVQHADFHIFSLCPAITSLRVLSHTVRNAACTCYSPRPSSSNMLVFNFPLALFHVSCVLSRKVGIVGSVICRRPTRRFLLLPSRFVPRSASLRVSSLEARFESYQRSKSSPSVLSSCRAAP